MALAYFSNLKEFKNWVRGIDASTSLDDIKPSYLSAKEIVFGIIESKLWELFNAYHLAQDPVDEKKAQIVEYIQSALANFTMIQEFPYISADEDKDWYKYQVDGQIARYRENGWTALNNLISYLDANKETFTDWEETTAYSERQKLIISDYKVFDSIYSIDQSAYFFYRITFLQKEIIRDIILPRIKTWADVSADAKTAEAVKNAIVYQTMANAIKRLDFVNLPKSIRNVVSNEQTKAVRSGYSVKKLNDTLAEELQTLADNYIDDIEYQVERLNSIDDAEEITPNLNDEDNKFYSSI